MGIADMNVDNYTNEEAKESTCEQKEEKKE